MHSLHSGWAAVSPFPMNAKDVRAADFVLLIVSGLLAAVLGHKALSDPDIGWHMAGGLSIIEHRSVPHRDILSAVDSFWWCYSWLAELLFAAWFRLGGFPALRLLQTLLIVSSAWALLHLLRSARRRSFNLRAEIAALGVSLFLIAPTWHLRPQLISIILFCLLLAARERSRLRLPTAVVLSAVWANIHVYWILAPLVVGLERLLNLRSPLAALIAAAICFAAGLISPYGLTQLTGLAQYAFYHDAGNSLIKEFRALPAASPLLFIVVAVISAIAWTRRTAIAEREPADSIALVLLLLAGAMVRLKFLPLLAVAAAPLLSRSVFGAIFPEGFPSTRRQQSSQLPLAAALIAFGLTAAAALRLEPPVAPQKQELLSAAEVLSDAAAGEDRNITVLNDFNHGGWLALGFWLYRPADAEISRLLVSVDGRTLVMGADRLQSYRRLLLEPERADEIARNWSAEAAILPGDSLITTTLLDAGWLRLATVQSLAILCLPQTEAEDGFCAVSNSSRSPTSMPADSAAPAATSITYSAEGT